jgi:two-component system, cell cycle response regulator DivK
MIEKTIASFVSNTEEAKNMDEPTVDWSDKTIMIAEDEEVNFVYLQTALAITNINIVRARNGVEAVELARITPSIQLILMDIKMPKMNGIEATRSIKQFRSDIVIIAQTAFVMEEDRKNCFSVGVDDFLSKPVRFRLLFDTLAKHLK